jgi:hypothetical protein
MSAHLSLLGVMREILQLSRAISQRRFNPILQMQYCGWMSIRPTVHDSVHTWSAFASGGVYLQSMKAAADALGMELTGSPVNDPAERDRLRL